MIDNNLIIVGTLHAGMTPEAELREVLEEHRPEVLLVEIAQPDIEKNRLSKYPPEMIFALNWARAKRVMVYGFDSPINPLMSGKTDADNAQVIEEQKQAISGYSWRDANREEIVERLSKAAQDLVDPVKEKQREEEMCHNIKARLDPQKKTLILTGAGHLKFLEENFPGALFPWR